MSLVWHIWKGVSVTGQVGGTWSPGSTMLMFAGGRFTVHLNAL
jgi:hypothetical protein